MRDITLNEEGFQVVSSTMTMTDVNITNISGTDNVNFHIWVTSEYSRTKFSQFLKFKYDIYEYKELSYEDKYFKSFKCDFPGLYNVDLILSRGFF